MNNSIVIHFVLVGVGKVTKKERKKDNFAYISVSIQRFLTSFTCSLIIFLYYKERKKSLFCSLLKSLEKL